MNTAEARTDEKTEKVDLPKPGFRLDEAFQKAYIFQKKDVLQLDYKIE